MRKRRGIVELYGVRRRRASGPRWPRGWDFALGEDWAPIARMRSALEDAKLEASSALQACEHRRAHEKQGARLKIASAASAEGEQLVWAIVWLLRWAFDRADARAIQKEGRRAA